VHIPGLALISPDLDQYADIRSSMKKGSLVIGSIDNDYGGNTRTNSDNMAGLLLSTKSKTEIAVNHHNVRIVSLMHYTSDNKIIIGRDMGWGVTPVNIANNLTVNGNLSVNGSITFAYDDNQWLTPFLLNNWVNYDTSVFNPAQYRKDGDGVVWLRGLVKGGAAGSIIFSLPLGYRPTNRQLHGVCTSESVMGRVDVYKDGRVQIVNGSSVWLSLDGIAFRASPSL
jgi:hypothetical protein